MPETLFDLGPGDIADTSNDYYTPRWIFDAAGLMFDMDVAAPIDPSRRTCPAKSYLTPIENGLIHPWRGLVWMNPPYSDPSSWVGRFAAHRNGLALLPAARNALWLGNLLHCADAIALISTTFTKADGSVDSARYLNLLAACGSDACAAVARIAAKDRCARGAYHVRP